MAKTKRQSFIKAAAAVTASMAMEATNHLHSSYDEAPATETDGRAKTRWTPEVRRRN
jgi:hypothetical protein